MNDVVIRTANEGDSEQLLEIYSHYIKNTAITFECDIPSVEEFCRRIKETLNRYPYLVAERNGEILGYAYASPLKTRAAYDVSAETTVYVRNGMKRMGIGRALYGELERLLSLQNVTNLYANVACPEADDEYLTADSVRFHEREGYVTVGRFQKCGLKFGRRYSILWMEKLIGNVDNNSEGFIPFPELHN